MAHQSPPTHRRFSTAIPWTETLENHREERFILANQTDESEVREFSGKGSVISSRNSLLRVFAQHLQAQGVSGTSSGLLPRKFANLSFFGLVCWNLGCLTEIHERKKHPKKICIKNFGGTLAGGSRRGVRRPNSLCRCWFSQQNTVHKEFRGGVLRGSWGWGSKVQFWGPISLCLCAFLGLEKFSVFRAGAL